jgi:hypothetical protein
LRESSPSDAIAAIAPGGAANGCASRLRARDAHRFEQTHRFKITVTTARPVAVRLTKRIVVGDPPAVEANMTDVVDLNFLARQMDRLLTEMQSVRDDMRVLSAQVMRLDSSAQAMAQELGAISGLLAEQSPPSS